jgi:hypothetical protein
MGFSNFHYCHNFYNNSVTFSTIPTINTTKNYCILNFERMPTMETEENQQQQLDKVPLRKK